MFDHYKTTRITLDKFPGWVFLVKHHYDSDSTAPWEGYDYNGEVTLRGARHHPHPYGTGKAAGEVVIHEDRGTVWCYDYAGAMKKAKRDGWGLTPDALANLKLEMAYHQIRRVEFNNYKARAARAVELAATITPTPGQIRRAAVDADMKRMRAWLRNDWHWCWIRVEACEAPEGIDVDALDFQSLGGIESDGEDYILECARELADQIAGPAMEAKAAADVAKVVADAELAALRLDAERYRKLRAMHWSDNELAVLLHPQDNAKAGSVTFHGRTLDTVLDGRPAPEHDKAERVAADKQARLVAALLSAWGTIDHARFACNPEVVMTECDWNTVQGHLAAALHDIDGRVMPERFRGQTSR